jgi:hypothetical protein
MIILFKEIIRRRSQVTPNFFHKRYPKYDMKYQGSSFDFVPISFLLNIVLKHQLVY